MATATLPAVPRIDTLGSNNEALRTSVQELHTACVAIIAAIDTAETGILARLDAIESELET